MVKLKFKKDSIHGKYVGLYLYLLSIGNRTMINDKPSKNGFNEIISCEYESHFGLYPKYIDNLLGTYEFAFTRSIFIVISNPFIKINPKERIELKLEKR
jgi:hypothetical protein